MRLFFALEIPIEARRVLAPIAAATVSACPGSRPVRIENYHVTLHFVGECGPAKTDALCGALLDAFQWSQELDPPFFPLKLMVSGHGFFRSGSGRILWLSVEPHRVIERFRSFLLEAMRNRGLQPQGVGPMVPHITIARKAGDTQMDNGFGGIPGCAGITEVLEFEVAAPSLMESVSVGSRTEYRAICRPGCGDGRSGLTGT